MAVAAKEKIDFTVMYLTHDAFRRDLGRLESAVAGGRAASPGVLAGWANFKKQLHVHHSVEDAALWPQVISAAAGRPEDLMLMKEMEAEHAALDAPLEAVDAGLSRPGKGLAGLVEELSAVLVQHMRHEEESALPLIQSLLTPQHWNAFRRAMARRQGPKGAAMYVPWILDSLGPQDQRRFLSSMGPPVAVINKLFWQSRYDRRQLWGS